MENLNSVITTYFAHSISIVNQIGTFEIIKLVELIDRTRKNGRTVYVAGNGGSATTATHFATDIGVGSLTNFNAVRALSLTDSSSNLTAIANDLDYSKIIEQQLKLLGEQGDLLIVISASGNSINLLKAVELADRIGIESYSMTGFNGGRLKELTLGRNIHIETKIGSYGLVEDAHLSICHVVTECLRSIK
jgi:D-sedoheptulose 7-phosphate isomerase